MNNFVNLVVSGSGPGAAVDVSAMGQTKTIVVGGLADGNINIEYSEDGVSWAPIASFQSKGTKTVDVAAMFMRTNVTAGGGGANVDVGGSTAGTVAAQIPTPPDGGIGAQIDISALPLFKTVVVSGFDGTVNIEVSEDGNSWAQVMTFHGAGGKSALFYAQFARARSSDGAPTIWIAGANEGVGEGFAAFPTAGVPVTTTIYARTTGSDTSGNGTLASPYATFARAILDVPKVIDPGYRFVVDITDLGTEILPQDWSAPPIVCNEELWFVLDQSFLFTGSVAIRAYPKLVITPNAQIGAADAPVIAADGPGLCKITVAGAAWAPSALKGKQIRRNGVQSASCCIHENTATELFLCNTAGAMGGALAPGQTFDIVEPSAKLTAPPSTGNRESILFNIPSISFMGIALECTVPGVGNGGLLVAKSAIVPTFELCVLDEATFAADGALQVILFSTTITGYVQSSSSQLTPRRSYWNTPEFIAIQGRTSQLRTTVFEAGTPSITAAGGVAGPAPADSLAFLNCWWKGAAGDAIAAISPMRIDLTACQIDNSVGHAISANGPCQAVLTGVIGSGNTGYGVRADDGAHVQVDATTTVGNADARAYSNGNMAPVAAWPGAPFNSTDLTLGAETLSRVWSA